VFLRRGTDPLILADNNDDNNDEVNALFFSLALLIFHKASRGVFVDQSRVPECYIETELDREAISGHARVRCDRLIDRIDIDKIRCAIIDLRGVSVLPPPSLSLSLSLLFSILFLSSTSQSCARPIGRSSGDARSYKFRKIKTASATIPPPHSAPPRRRSARPLGSLAGLAVELPQKINK